MTELLTIQEVARILRVDETTIRRWIMAGVIEAVFLPSTGKRKKYRIKRETLEKILRGDFTLPESE